MFSLATINRMNARADAKAAYQVRYRAAAKAKKIESEKQGEKVMEKKLDLVSKIMDYEEGEMGQEDVIEFFQELIDSGLAWTLQGSYGRMAMSLIKSGYCKDNELRRGSVKLDA